MKRFLLAIVILLAVFCFSSVTMAGEYETRKVTKKQTQQKDKKSKKQKKKIHKKYKKAKFVKRGQIKSAAKASGPWRWENHGKDKHRCIEVPVTDAELVQDIMEFHDMSLEDKKLLIAEVKAGKRKVANLSYGELRMEMHSGSGIKGTGIGVFVGGREDVAEPVWRYEVVKEDGSRLILDIPWRCYNTTWGIEFPKKPEPPEPPTTKEIPPETTITEEIPEEKKPEGEPPEQKIEPPDAKGPKNVYDEVEIYLGGGINQNVHYSETHGWYLWGKIRYRPIRTKLGGNWKMDNGVFLTGSEWGGMDQKYGYHGGRIGGGWSNKVYNKNIEVNSDLGFGYQWDRGGVDDYSNRQDGMVGMGTIAYDNQTRRNKGKVWVPRHGAYLDFVIPFTAERNSSYNGQSLNERADNVAYYEVGMQIGIYDITNGSWRFTPGFNLAFGHHWSNGKSYYRFGPNIIINAYKNDVLNINLLNYKEELGGRGDELWYLSGYWDVSGTYRAWKASRIKPASRAKIEAKTAAALQESN